MAVPGMSDDFKGASPNAHFLVGEMPAPAQFKTSWWEGTGASLVIHALVLALIFYAYTQRAAIVDTVTNANEKLDFIFLESPKGPGGGSQPTPDGRRPEPGGWNRIIVRTESLDRDVQTLRKSGVHFRSDVVAGPGGRQILAEDPSGNLVELFEAAAG